MKNIVQFPEKGGLQNKAIQWLVKMEDDEWSEQDKHEFLIWIDEATQHREMFLQVASFWCEMDVLTSIGELLNQAPEQKAITKKRSGFSYYHNLRLRPAQWAASIAIVSILTLGLLSVLPLIGISPPEKESSQSIEIAYKTRVGEQTRAVLTDGSIMTLNTLTHATARFNSTERAVYLDSGEAYFEVAKNQKLPFHVYAGKGRITAVGTEFNVRVQNELVNVAVSEGSVAVAAELDNNIKSRTQPVSSLIIKKEGIVNYADAIEDFKYVGPEMIEKKLAWKRGKLVFEGETLEQVIAETNRYTQKKLQIADPDIAQLRVGGLFDTGDVTQLLALFKGSFGIEVVEAKGEVLYLAIPEHNKISPY